MSVTEESTTASVVGKLSALDRFLPAWMAVGLLGGRVVPRSELGPALMFTLACGDREAVAVLVALLSEG